MDPKNFEDPDGAFYAEGHSIPVLMKRGVVFLACHNAIWGEAAVNCRKRREPPRLTDEQLAAELTNHLLPGVVLTPGAVGTLPKFRERAFNMPNSNAKERFSSFFPGSLFALAA